LFSLVIALTSQGLTNVISEKSLWSDSLTKCGGCSVGAAIYCVIPAGKPRGALAKNLGPDENPEKKAGFLGEALSVCMMKFFKM
jgi:hypothetical protein